MFPNTLHVETIALLSKLSEAKHHIEVKVDMDELDLTSAEAKATYKEIQDWVQEKYGFHVTNLNIAQVKQNGKPLGTKKVRDCKATFKVKYAPGTMTAIAGGKSSKLISAGEAAIAVRPETTEAKPSEILYIPIAIADKHGVLESNADRSLSMSVEGGELLGFGSANPRTEERFDAGTYSTYYGHALAVVRAGEKGSVRLSVTDGKRSASAEIIIMED